MHLIIRSLNKHIDDLCNLVSLLHFTPDIIILYASPNLALINQW